MASPREHAKALEQYAERVQRAFSPEVTQRAMLAVGLEARFIIYRRTVLESLDRDGSPFPPYTTERVEIMPNSVYYSMLSGSGRKYRLPHRRHGEAGPKPQKRRGSKKDKLIGAVFDGGWAQIKSSIGAPRRNMMMRGDMMGQATNPGFSVVASSGDTVTIDFLNARERLKAAGQHKRFNWWGVGRIETERRDLIAAFMGVIRQAFQSAGPAP